jgi:hypothetical protein
MDSVDSGGVLVHRSTMDQASIDERRGLPELNVQPQWAMIAICGTSVR